jgi:hypothetical protein
LNANEKWQAGQLVSDVYERGNSRVTPLAARESSRSSFLRGSQENPLELLPQRRLGSFKSKHAASFR